MSQERLRMGNSIETTIFRFDEKIEMHLKRKAFSQQNAAFELYKDYIEIWNIRGLLSTT